MSCHTNWEKRQHLDFPSPQKGYHCSYLMGQSGDILRMSLAPICAAISSSYLKSYEECFVVKVNLVGEKKSALGFVPVTIQRETYPNHSFQ